MSRVQSCDIATNSERVRSSQAASVDKPARFLCAKPVTIRVLRQKKRSRAALLYAWLPGGHRITLR